MQKFKNAIASLVLLLFAANSYAARLHDSYKYYPDSFYQNVDNGESDANLKRELFEILNSAHTPSANGHDVLSSTCGSSNPYCYRHFSLGYTVARKILFGELHLEKHGNSYAIRDVYCQHLSVPGDYHQNPPGPGQIPDPAVLNAEHTWPQSKFSSRFDRDLQKSDLHILYPAMAEANTSRSNHEFNEVSAPLESPCPTISRRGHSNGEGNQVFFEPPESHKGNVARAIFYFAIRYQMPVSKAQESSLRAWHRADPPDEFERRRNETIFAKQKDRNPFVDHPELVDLISDF